MNNQVKLTQQQIQSMVVTRSLELKAKRGEYPGKPPIGYLNNPRTKQIVSDPKTWDTVKNALEKYATGDCAIAGITLFLNEHLSTVRNCERQLLTKTQVKAILRNPFYTGKFKFRDKIYQGKHKPMISEEIFNEIQKQLECNEK